MKTKLILLVLLIACFSCGTNNKPVSDAQKEKIKGEVKEVVNTYFKGAEEANADLILETYLDSPDFVFTYNGNSFSYKQCEDMAKSVFGTLKNQKITVVDEKYAVLDNSTVLVTVNNKCLMNYKDGHSVLQDPWISQILFKKIDNKWKVISGAESGIERSVKNTETAKELNQVELMKQFLGTWQQNISKDTAVIWEWQTYGKGFLLNGYNVIKGEKKPSFIDSFSFNLKEDKFKMFCLWANGKCDTWILFFTTENIYHADLVENFNSEKVSTKVQGVLVNPTEFTHTVFNKDGVKIGEYKFTKIN